MVEYDNVPFDIALIIGIWATFLCTLPSLTIYDNEVRVRRLKWGWVIFLAACMSLLTALSVLAEKARSNEVDAMLAEFCERKLKAQLIDCVSVLENGAEAELERLHIEAFLSEEWELVARLENETKGQHLSDLLAEIEKAQRNVKEWTAGECKLEEKLRIIRRNF